MQAIPGYLSLHQTAEVMTLKWTPNQLMNGSVGDLDYERRYDTEPRPARRPVAMATITVIKQPQQHRPLRNLS